MSAPPFCWSSCEAYLALMAESCGRLGVEVWAYRLMPVKIKVLRKP